MVVNTAASPKVNRTLQCLQVPSKELEIKVSISKTFQLLTWVHLPLQIKIDNLYSASPTKVKPFCHPLVKSNSLLIKVLCATSMWGIRKEMKIHLRVSTEIIRTVRWETIMEISWPVRDIHCLSKTYGKGVTTWILWTCRHLLKSRKMSWRCF